MPYTPILFKGHSRSPGEDLVDDLDAQDALQLTETEAAALQAKQQQVRDVVRCHWQMRAGELEPAQAASPVLRPFPGVLWDRKRKAIQRSQRAGGSRGRLDAGSKETSTGRVLNLRQQRSLLPGTVVTSSVNDLPQARGRVDARPRVTDDASTPGPQLDLSAYMRVDGPGSVGAVASTSGAVGKENDPGKKYAVPPSPQVIKPSSQSASEVLVPAGAKGGKQVHTNGVTSLLSVSDIRVEVGS